MNLLYFMLISAAVSVDLCPAPQSIDVDTRHVFRVVSRTPVVVADDATNAELADLELLFEAIGFKLPIRRASAHTAGLPAIYIGEPGRHAALATRKVKRFVSSKEVDVPQGYRLVIDRKAVAIAGADPAGTFYGLQTLARLAARSIELPCLTIRDYPDLALRGVYLHGAATRDLLRRLAAHKCNLAVFESTDFYDLAGDAGAKWRCVFEDARALHIEPVPLIRVLANAGPLVEMNPLIAEGRVAEDQIVLEGEKWQRLSKRNLIATATSPICVRVSGHLCKPDSDYALDAGTITPPFAENEAPWLIRRVPGGAIPDGATVTVTYTYVPPGTTACCPSAPETRVVLRKVLEGLIDTLGPCFIHVGHGAVERLNACLRCRQQGKSNAAIFADSIAMLDELAKENDTAVRLMLWADAINPVQDASSYDLADAGELLPRDVALVVRTVDAGPVAESIAWCGRVGLDLVGAPGASPATACAWCNALAPLDQVQTGLLYTGGDVSVPAFECAMDKAWSRASPRSIWAEALNACFDAALWRPDYEDVRDALTAHVNRQTLAGVPPDGHYKAFEDHLKTVRKQAPGAEADLRRVNAVYRHLVTYLELEQAFAEDRRPSILRGLVKLTEVHGDLDPAMDPDRVRRIVETVETKGLFVPSTILFGRHLVAYRAMHVPPGACALEVSVTPQYADRVHQAAATYDLLACPGPICRIDFETVGAATLTVERSNDGDAYEPAQEWKSDLRGGVAGPAILHSPFRAPFLRVVARAPAERAVLRSTRLFALKLPARVTCAYARVVPRPGDTFDDIAWPDEGRAEGFIRVDEPLFAQAPTIVQVCRTRDALFIGAKAHEPRMRTLVATRTQRNAPLWEEESFEAILFRGVGEPFRFVVNPLGARFDSHGWDPGWDGAWQVVTQTQDTAWSAVLAIPFDTFNATPARGDTWRVNFVRNRHNVHKERTTWSAKGDSRHPDDLGLLAFD